jgi:hypothetical protein
MINRNRNRRPRCEKDDARGRTQRLAIPSHCIERVFRRCLLNSAGGKLEPSAPPGGHRGRRRTDPAKNGGAVTMDCPAALPSAWTRRRDARGDFLGNRRRVAIGPSPRGPARAVRESGCSAPGISRRLWPARLSILPTPRLLRPARRNQSPATCVAPTGFEPVFGRGDVFASSSEPIRPVPPPNTRTQPLVRARVTRLRNRIRQRDNPAVLGIRATNRFLGEVWVNERG